MTLSKQAIIITVILSVVLFVAGFYVWPSFFILLLPIVNGAKYLETDMTAPFYDSLLFGLVLALIPGATLLVWRFARMFKTRKKILTVCIIVLAMISSMLIRREAIKSQLTNLKPSTATDYSDTVNPVQTEIQTWLPISDLKFEYFALIGVIAGSIISLFALKEKTNKKTTF